MQAAYARNYRRLWDEHWWWRARRRFVLGKLEALNRRRPLKRMLDVGCGDGLFFDELSRFGEIWGVEPDESLVDPDGRWRARIRLEAFGADYRDERRYELILMLDSLEHIRDEDAALRAATALLEPDGALFLTVPALPSLWSAHDEANHHYRRYTKDTLRASLERAGLVPDDMGYYFCWPVPLMYGRKLSTRGQAEYEVAPPPAPVNKFMYALSVLEQTLAPAGTPIGSSLFALCRRA